MKMDLNKLHVTLDTTLPPSASFTEITETLHKIQECRFVVFAFEYKTPEGGDRGKSVHLLWAPSAAPLKQRTVYAAFNTAVRTKLEGISLELQASDVSEIQREDVRHITHQLVACVINHCLPVFEFCCPDCG